MKTIKIDQPNRFFDGLVEVLGGMLLLGLLSALVIIVFCL